MNVLEVFIAYISAIAYGILKLAWYFIVGFFGALLAAFFAFLLGGCVAHKTTTIYPTYKGASVRAPGSTGYIISDGKVYRTYNGSQVPSNNQKTFIAR